MIEENAVSLNPFFKEKGNICTAGFFSSGKRKKLIVDRNPHRPHRGRAFRRGPCQGGFVHTLSTESTVVERRLWTEFGDKGLEGTRVRLP